MVNKYFILIIFVINLLKISYSDFKFGFDFKTSIKRNTIGFICNFSDNILIYPDFYFDISNHENYAEVIIISNDTEESVSENIELLKIVLTPASLGLMKRLLTTKNVNLRVRKTISYGFIISDEEHGIIEMPHPLSDEFYAAFQFTNAYLGQRLQDIFQALYEDAKEDPQFDFARKTLGIPKQGTRKK